MKKLAAQAHGEALTQLITAWEQRSGDLVPTLQELGKAVSAPVRSSWVQSVSAAPAGDAAEALLRLEIAAEAPTPAEHALCAESLAQFLTAAKERKSAQPEAKARAALVHALLNHNDFITIR